MTTLLKTTQDTLYPETDGLPLSDNTKQFRLMMTTQGGLDDLFKNEPVLVVGNLLWYPLQRNPDEVKSTAPDVMVIFGQDKKDRTVYKQWEEGNLGPQVTFEFVSKNNSVQEVEVKKLAFYEKHGVEEYYIHDPEQGTLKGWLRQGERLEPIESMNGWVSPRLGIRFELVDGDLRLYYPNGKRFATYLETIEQWERAELERDRERQLKEQEQQRADREQQLREQAELERDRERKRAESLAARLLALGIDPDELD